jgi:hypothetical protein
VWNRIVAYRRTENGSPLKSADRPHLGQPDPIALPPYRCLPPKRAVSTEKRKLRSEVLIPKDSPITQVEIEVFAARLDDWGSLLAECDKDIPK